jgi:adenylate kinase family enzyme
MASAADETGSGPGQLIVLTGPPGVGKTTVATLLADQYSPSVHLHADDFWRFIRRGAIAPYLRQAHRQNTVVIASLARAASAYATGGYHVIVDGIIGPWFIEDFRAAADMPPDQIHYLILRPDEATTLQRAIGRGADALTTLEPVRTMYHQFTGLGPYERHVIDSTELNPATTTDRARHAITGRGFILAPSSEQQP